MSEVRKYDVVIIGGGFFGCSLAMLLKKYFKNIAVVEKENDILQRASYANQARVHNGYHYPRSILTALRSRVNFPRFIKDYKECIVNDFEKYYVVGSLQSKVTGNQFEIFMKRIGAPIKQAPKNIIKLFNKNLVDAVFSTTEYAFDAVKLKNRVQNDLKENSISLLLNTKVTKIKNDNNGKGQFIVYVEENGQSSEIHCTHVFNCTYSQINEVLINSNLPRIYLKHELTEMVLVKVPSVLEDLAITMMCGPFFSLMPFPPKSSHILSHVRYTPHHEWHDTENNYINAHEYFERCKKKTNYINMIKDTARYLPSIIDSEYLGSIWEVKTVLPSSEADDGRPILFRKDHGVKNLTCIMGGKIDNIYDMQDEISDIHYETLNNNTTL